MNTSLRCSAFVAANAGSGKTHVLVQRVIRLLLDRVPPEKILCITFTKAAAANMAERVFTTLGHWVTLDDEALNHAIREAGIAHPTAKLRREAPFHLLGQDLRSMIAISNRYARGTGVIKSATFVW